MNQKSSVRHPEVVESTIRSPESDGRIASSFKESYVFKAYLTGTSIETHVKDGVVTLTGGVVSEAQRTLANDLAWSVPGVLVVHNQLETEQEVDAEKADNWMGRKIKLALLFRSNVSGLSTMVEVKDGVVTLTGDAESDAQKELTTAYAKDIEGVISVKNNMGVATEPVMSERSISEKIDDASVRTLVKASLATHLSTRAVDAAVTTRNGEVTLTGIANNGAEKALVTKLVKDIHGVSSVNNKMTIAEPTTI